MQSPQIHFFPLCKQSWKPIINTHVFWFVIFPVFFLKTSEVEGACGGDIVGNTKI